MLKRVSHREYSLTIKNQISDIEQIVEAVDMLSDEWNLTKKINNQLNLICEEIVSNIVFYGYTDKNEHTIVIELQKEKKAISIQIIDNGKYFDLLKYNNQVDVNATAEERDIGGLGIHILETLVDSMEYTRKGNLNVVKLIKQL